MTRIEQPDDQWAQTLLGVLHLYALSLATVAVYVHGKAWLHHWQRAGLVRETEAAFAKRVLADSDLLKG